MRYSDALDKIAPALVKALASITGAAKDSTNPYFTSRYASLESVIDASREVLAENGLAVIQLPGDLTGGVLSLETVLLHTSGQYISGNFEIAVGKLDPQGVGSAVSYARRYALMAALNMPAVDDDGEAAMQAQKAPDHNLASERNGAGPSPEGPDWWGCSGPGMSANAAKKDGRDLRHEDMRTEIAAISTGNEWKEWCRINTPDIGKMPKAWRVILREEAEEVARELGVDFNGRR